MITEKQKRERMNGVGASDVSIITGHCKFKTSFELYMEKLGEITPKEPGVKADAGTFLEEGIAKLITHQTRMKLFKVKDTIYHPDHSFIFCHLDRETKDKIPYEIKNSTEADLWGDPDYGSESIPISVHIQVQMQMACTGAKMAFVACLLFGYQLKIYEVYRDDELIDMLIKKVVTFWDHVQNRTPPPVEYNHPTANDLLKRVFKGSNGEKIQLPDEAQDWHKHKKTWDEYVKEGKERAKYFEAKIREAMGENAVGVLPDGTAYTRNKNKAGNIVLRHSKYVPGEK